MSKAGKIPANLFAASSASSFRRVVGQRPKRRFYLIVCEGEKTEPNYFESIRLKLPKEMIPRVVVRGTGRNTLSLVDEVEEIIEQRRCQDLPPFYKIWVVMDRDSFPPEDFDNAIRQIEQRSETQGANKWYAAWSNEAFELWYLLHFTDQTGGPIHRDEYAAKLEKFLGHPYEKNSPSMFKELQDKTLLAIQRAERGHSLQVRQHIPYHQMNPATTVYQLVRELIRYMDSLA
ncbi:MAG: RloB domain-containing protein [Victivallales bacterium]|jgi:hypothetical protein|nr:RloB domain-containing protein [Victivallales bacterium]